MNARNAMNTRKESPVFVKLFDFVAWVIPLTTKFPREQRFVVAERLHRAVLNAQEAVTRAGMSHSSAQVAAHLDEAATHLTLARMYLRLAYKLALITVRQYEYAMEQLAQIGKLIQGWRKGLSLQ